MRILAVDDEPEILTVLGLVLRGAGYPDVTMVRSHREAFKAMAAADQPFDCFLLDIQMPDMSGIELCRKIRATAQYAMTPIIMITAMSEKSYVDAAFVAGATDFLTKPFEFRDLTARVRGAERIVVAENQARAARLQAQEAVAMREDAQRLPLSEAFLLDDVEGLVDYLAIENYLLQLSRGHMVGTNVFALRIQDVGQLYAKASPWLYRDTLAYVAEAAIAALAGENCVLAHAGNGIFAGVNSSAEPFDPEEYELIINGILDGLDLLDDSGNKLNVQLTLAAPVRVGLMHSPRAAIHILRREVESIVWLAPRQNAIPRRESKGGSGFLNMLRLVKH